MYRLNRQPNATVTPYCSRCVLYANKLAEVAAEQQTQQLCTVSAAHRCHTSIFLMSHSRVRNHVIPS